MTDFLPLNFFRFLAVCAALLAGPGNAWAQGSGSPAKPAQQARIVLAGGCFWCMEGPFDILPGVVSTTSGYIGGTKKDPTYREVSSGTTGHTEAVEIVFDPTRVSVEKLLDVFWHNIDPTQKDAQFCDHGTQYRSGIFYVDEAQRKAAEASKAALEKRRVLKAPIVTEITAATTFYPAEDYHQDYYLKNPVRYKFYRNNCGRDARLKELWGDAAGKGILK
ncbi:MAG TPA: peptide-methionine (S)-S-oxide reductase MsrA [Usitatibacteraceae bacterium]|nr:peptide-methionine (S)-S-oxide reductase MsrA [Usitatibacteraceae bacterium]